MFKNTRFALISDLHIGREAISIDLCPHPLDPKTEVGMERDFVRKFREFVTSDAFTSKGPIDALCVTGDISDSADPKEFELADKVIRELADSLKVPPDAVFFVPGNHDIHWAVMELDPISFWDKFRYEPMLQKQLIFRARMDAAVGAFDQSPHFALWQSEKYVIVGINSAAFDRPKPEDGKHHGLIQQMTLDELQNSLAAIPYKAEQIRLCLIHHHPINYSDFQQELADFSAAINAGNLFSLLSSHRFDMLFHGHKHVPQLNHISSNNNGHPVTVLGAGSLSAQISSEWCGLAQNQFHVIDVVGRDPKTHAVYGHVITWNFTGKRWREAHNALGMSAKEGFGTLSTAMELEGEIKDCLVQIFGDQTVHYCQWPKIEKHAPQLAFVSTKAAYSALANVTKTLNMGLAGDLDSKRQDWTVLRKGIDNHD